VLRLLGYCIPTTGLRLGQLSLLLRLIVRVSGRRTGLTTSRPRVETGPERIADGRQRGSCCLRRGRMVQRRFDLRRQAAAEQNDGERIREGETEASHGVV
jgi:hypothetical protein